MVPLSIQVGKTKIMKKFILYLFLTLSSLVVFGQSDDLIINISSGCKDGVPVRSEFILKSITGATIASYTTTSPLSPLVNTDINFGGFIDFDVADLGTSQEFYTLMGVSNSNAAILQTKVTFDCSGGLYENEAYTSVYLDRGGSYTLQIDPINLDSFGLSQNGSQLPGQLCVDSKEKEYIIISGDTCGVITTETFIDCSISIDTLRYTKDTSLCITYIEDVGHNINYTELAAVYYLNGEYTTNTGPMGDTLAPVGLLHEVIDSNNFVLIRCGFTETTYPDGFYYYTDTGISNVPNEYAQTPIFITHNGVASVNVDFSYLTPEEICIEEPSTPFLIDIATVYNNDLTNVNINGTPVTFDNLNNAVDNGGGSLSLTGAGSASSSEYFNIGFAEMTLSSDPDTQFQNNAAVTFGISYFDYSANRFTADFEIYLGAQFTAQVRERGNVVYTGTVGQYDLGSVVRIQVNANDVEYYIDNTLIYTSVNGLPDPMCVPISEWAATQDSINNTLTVVESIFHTNATTVPTVSESDEYFVVPAVLSGAILDRVTFSSVTPQQANVQTLVSLTYQDALGNVTQDVGQTQIGNLTRSAASSPQIIVSEGDLIWVAVDRLADIQQGLGLSATLTFIRP